MVICEEMMRDFENQEQQDGDDDFDEDEGPPQTRAIPAGPLPAPLIDQQAQAGHLSFIW